MACLSYAIPAAFPIKTSLPMSKSELVHIIIHRLRYYNITHTYIAKVSSHDAFLGTHAIIIKADRLELLSCDADCESVLFYVAGCKSPSYIDRHVCWQRVAQNCLKKQPRLRRPEQIN